MVVASLAMVLAPIGSPAQAIDKKVIDSIIEEALRAWQVPGVAVAIVKDDQVVYVQGFGVRDVGKPDRVTPDTLFGIASVTKSFTAAAVGFQVDDGVMAWDDPVRKHLDYFRLADPLASDQATLRDLLCHRTGLAGNNELWGDSPWGREELIRRTGLIPLSQPFRSTWQYQNIMYLAAGEAAAAAAKRSWEDIVRQRIFEPLGMKSANFSATQTAKAANHATPHRKDATGQVAPIPFRNLDVAGPFVSINASARDMAQWLRFQLGDGRFDGKRLMSEQQLREMQTPQIALSRQHEILESLLPEHNFFSYGLGWFINDYRNHVLVWHSGDIDGFSALLTLVPKSKIGIVILSNLDGSYMRYALQYNLLDYLLSLPKQDWNTWQKAAFDKVMQQLASGARSLADNKQPNTKPSHNLSSYVGVYDDAAYGRVEVTVKDGHLWIRWNAFHGELEHLHYDTFVTSKEGPPYLQSQPILFALAVDGTVDSLQMYGRKFARKQ